MTRAPILGITGLILLLFGLLAHWLTYNPVEGFFSFGWFSATHLLAGVACLAWYFVSGSGSLTQFVRARSTRYGANALIYSLLFVAVVGMINFLGARYHKRIDVSEAGINTLSDQSRQVVERLEKTVQIDVFLQAGRDPVLEELFDAYRYRNDKIEVRFIDPQVRPELAQEAGITQVPSMRVSMEDRSTIITDTGEESVTNAIQRVANPEQKKIYFIEGHGEPAIDDTTSIAGFGLFADALRKQNYLVETVFIPEVEAIPSDAAVVIASSSEREWFPAEIETLAVYVRTGGRVLFLLEPQRDANLVELLKDWGATIGDDVIVDQQIRLFQGVTLGLEPVVSRYGDHPSVAPLKDRTLFSLARSVRPAENPRKGLVVVPILFTAPTSWAETDLERLFRQNEAQIDDGDIEGPVSLAVAVSAFAKDVGGTGDAELQLSVFGDSTWVTNKYWRQLFNDALALSVVGWLAGEEERISIGPRAVRASRAHLTQAQAQTVFYLSVLVIPELILLCGIAVWWRRSAL